MIPVQVDLVIATVPVEKRDIAGKPIEVARLFKFSGRDPKTGIGLLFSFPRRRIRDALS
jgi:hypothetical protein